jgi:putative tryptophan/tyrosine transport system substrate-binding protein
MIATRRAFVAALALGALGAPLPGRAQESRPRKIVRIGRLSPLSAEADAQNLDAFRRGMRDLGWVEGETFTIESRFSDGHNDRLPRLAAELVRLPVDLILTGSSPGALAAKQATSTIPIVMITTSDPVGDGIVTSLARPGGNVTGMTALSQALNTKRLELIKETVPGVARVGVLVNPNSSYTAYFLKERDNAARVLGLELRMLEAADAASLDKVLAGAKADRVGATLVQTNALFITHRRRIVDLLARLRLPAVYGELDFVDAGGLMFYGASFVNLYREVAVYADKILKGAKPADLPVEQPTKVELVVNQKAARALGLAIPPSVLVRADQVIER